MGRLFVGPKTTMTKMHSLLEDRGLPVAAVTAQWRQEEINKEAVAGLDGVEVLSQYTTECKDSSYNAVYRFVARTRGIRTG